MAAIAIFTGILFQQSGSPSRVLPDLEKVVILPNSKTLDTANFLDHTGKPFSKDDLKGYWNIIFFGFTNCPDICPTTMRTLAQIKNLMTDSRSWGNYRVIMVSVDPERDSLERLNNYVPYFDSEFIGLQGDLQTTTDFAKQMGILFVKQEPENGFYDVDHSVSIILVNPEAEMAGVITAPHSIEQISKDLTLLAEYYADDHKIQTTTEIANTHIAQNIHISSQHNATSISGDGSKIIEGLSIERAWIRPAPPSAPSMAAYFTLKNQSDKDINIVAAQSSDFGMLMIHDTVVENDIAKMQHRGSLTIPAQSEFILAPLGTHMMLMQPKHALGLGQTTEITLISDTGAQITQKIEVKQGAAEN